MPSIFTRIIEGDLPGRFVFRSDDVVAFLTIAPIKEGHTLVVPVREVDQWIDLGRDEISRVMEVAQFVARGIDAIFQPKRVAVVIAGLDVPHTHVHLIPIDSESEMRFSNASPARPADLDRVAASLASAVAALLPSDT